MVKQIVKYYKTELLSLLEEIYTRSNRNSVFNVRDAHKPFNNDAAFLSLYRFLYEFDVCQKRPSGGGERFTWLNPQEPKEIIDSVIDMLAEHEDSHFECIGETVPEALKVINTQTGDKRKIGFETNEDKILEYALEKGEEFTYSKICEDLKERVHMKSISAILSTLTTKGTLVRIKNGVYVHSDFSDGQSSVFSSRKEEAKDPFERSILTLISENGSMTLKDLIKKLGNGIEYMTFQQRMTSLCKRNLLRKLDRGVYAVFKKEEPFKQELGTVTVEPKVEHVAHTNNLQDSNDEKFSPINKDFRSKLSECLSKIDTLERSIAEKKSALEIEEKMLKDEKSRLEIMLSMKSLQVN